MDLYGILIHPIISEKAVKMIETENKIVFKVAKEANKDLIKKAMKEIYNVDVEKVNIINDMKGQKKAIIKLAKNIKASEFASKLGMV